MKKLLFLSAIGLLLFACSELTPDLQCPESVSSSRSSVITVDEAIKIASGFSDNAFNGAKSRSENEVGDVFVVTTDDIPSVSRAELLRPDTLLYVINYTNNAGFSVVGAKKELKNPVFIMSDYGYFQDNI